MEFITLPPEVSSALMHSGPGAESLLEASGAWQRLGADLEETASSYNALLSALAADWHGPSPLAMVQAAAPYLTWMRATAQQCQQLALSTQSAAAAFSSTLAAVVAPATVGANRTQLAHLLATNGFGKNLAAIAENEAQYQTMWVNNASAMYRYETASAQATALSLFASPPSVADPGAPAAQASAVSAAAAVAPADAIAPPVSPIDALMQAIGVTFDPDQGWFGLANTYANQFISSGFPINLLSYMAQNTSAQALQSVAPDIADGLSQGEAALSDAAAGISNAAGAFGALEPAAAVGVGVSLGNLSAPPATLGVLTAAQTPVQLASAVSPIPAGDAGFPMLPPLMPPPISAGSGWRKRKEPKYEDLAMGLELKGTFMPRPPGAG
ncbi:PPE family protein [Mycobacterium angelicum]|uniref:PPE domain-containing protein n=1 Tax=Mycobacterium angelicum TaxID=470074 RepID=A0A1X0A9E4_MYCAN|nr:PPE family protein [Mycobacterium angelicum]MCV7197679.1 PPE family protein [Mycobacterium angelicum]ORA26545.1 hypothetical protein BST12_01365 [Mycobacterium angelicum]